MEKVRNKGNKKRKEERKKGTNRWKKKERKDS